MPWLWLGPHAMSPAETLGTDDDRAMGIESRIDGRRRSGGRRSMSVSCGRKKRHRSFERLGISERRNNHEMWCRPRGGRSVERRRAARTLIELGADDLKNTFRFRGVRIAQKTIDRAVCFPSKCLSLSAIITHCNNLRLESSLAAICIYIGPVFNSEILRGEHAPEALLMSQLVPVLVLSAFVSSFWHDY